MTQLPKRPLRCLAANLLAAILVAGCAVSTSTDGGAATTATDVSLPAGPGDQGADGPHAAPDHALAPRSVTDSADGRSSIIDLDLGNVTAGSYAAPARGQVITPKEADGGEYAQVVEATDPALRDRATQADNGVYQLGTIRLELPERVTSTTVTSVRVQASEHPVEVHGMDFRG